VSYVYIKSESELWTVGFYGPRGEWVPESDHSNRAEAAERVAWLNGSGEPQVARTVGDYLGLRELEGLEPAEIVRRFYKDL
jgi:hypothetical protein